MDLVKQINITNMNGEILDEAVDETMGDIDDPVEKVCLFTFSYGGVAVYRCSEAVCYMYLSGYMLAGSHHLSRVSYLMKRHVGTCGSVEELKKTPPQCNKEVLSLKELNSFCDETSVVLDETIHNFKEEYDYFEKKFRQHNGKCIEYC
uniref:ADF-H domain-containing protein n=1 Tax=Strongyloides venezuelensis TaxID=75913 RepID=A0A0K0F6M4_STRVS